MACKIKPADIILYVATPSDELITRVVGAAQLLFGVGHRAITYSHVAIAAWTAEMQYESKFPFSGYFPIDQDRSYEIWRLKDITPERRGVILRDCRVHTGELYPLLKLLTFGLVPHIHNKVCSEWAAARAHKAGYRFAREGFPIVAPDVLIDSGALEYIGKGGRSDVRGKTRPHH